MQNHVLNVRSVAGVVRPWPTYMAYDCGVIAVNSERRRDDEMCTPKNNPVRSRKLEHVVSDTHVRRMHPAFQPSSQRCAGRCCCSWSFVAPCLFTYGSAFRVVGCNISHVCVRHRPYCRPRMPCPRTAHLVSSLVRRASERRRSESGPTDHEGQPHQSHGKGDLHVGAPPLDVFPQEE